MNVEVTQKNGNKIRGEFKGFNQIGNLMIRMNRGATHRDRPVPFRGVSKIINLDTGDDVTRIVLSKRSPTDPVSIPMSKLP